MATLALTPEFPADAPRSEPRALLRGGRGIRRILVCLDGSPLSEVCVPHAIALSRTFGSAITLLHVMQHPHEGTEALTTDALGWEICRREKRAYLERFEQEVAKALGRRVDVRLEQGRPAERITALARELGADLTVLGSHGESGVGAWNLGSTVQQVLAVARGSVFIARSTSPVPRVVSPKRILVPLDGSLRTESVLPTVARLARAHDAEVFLVHVVLEPQPTAVLDGAEDLGLAHDLALRMESGAKRYLEHLRDQLAHEIAIVRTRVIRHPDERQSLLELSRKERIDLVVLSAHGSTCNRARAFGSVTAHLLTYSTVPLFVLQDLPEPERLRFPEPGEEDEEVAPHLRASYPPEGV